MIPVIIIISFLFVAIGIYVFLLHKKKIAIRKFESAILNSPRIRLIKSINEKYQFKTFDKIFVHVIHFKDLDEYKTADLKLAKYNCLLRKKDEIVNLLESLNFNILNSKKYFEEIENAKKYDDSLFLAASKVDIQKYRNEEELLISKLIKKPLTCCSFDIYYDYVWLNGRIGRESEHFKALFDSIVDIDAFLNSSFPIVKREEYNFKKHKRYAQENENYICDSLFLTNDEINAKNELKKEKKRMGLQYGDDYDFFIKAKEELFAGLNKLGLKYDVVDPDNNEFIVIIEDLTFLFVGHYFFDVMPSSTVINHFTNYTPIVVELNYNPFFDFDPPTISRVHFAYFKYLTFSTKTPHNYAYKRAKLLIPNVDIEKINNEWEGLPSFCIVYELKRNDLYFYSIMITENVDNTFLVGNQNYRTILELSKVYGNKQNSKTLYEDIKTFGLSCDSNFMQSFINLENEIKSDLKESDTLEDKLYSYIEYYLVPIFIKSKNRNYVENLKKDIFSKLNHEYLKQFDSYHYVNGHQKWKNEYLLYEICKKLYGSQVIYQYRPSFLKLKNSQLSYDIYLSEYRIAIEYQGIQHFKPVDYFGGLESFADVQRRDKLKKELSKKAKIPLIEITYKENVTSELIKTKVQTALNEKLVQ